MTLSRFSDWNAKTLVLEQDSSDKKAFCPTGPGGGVDPTCGSGSGGGSRTANRPEWAVTIQGLATVQWSSQNVPTDIDTGYPVLKDAPLPIQKLEEFVKSRPDVRMRYGNVYQKGIIPRVELSLTDSENAAITKGLTKEEEIPLSQLKTRQSWIEGPRLVRMAGIDTAGAKESPTAIRLQDGTVLLLDGNHRATLSILKGEKSTIRLRVYQQDEVKLHVSFDEKAFCPTGPGGGVDPTCSPGKASAPAPTIVLEGPQITKVKPLSGGSNAPTYIEYTDGSGRPQKGMFKADGDEAASPYYQAFPRGSQAAREVTASLIGKELGLGDAVVSTQFAEVGGRRGVLQSWINDTAQVGYEYIDANFKGDRYSGDSAVIGKQMSKILEKVDGIEDMQYFDLLTGNADRHEGNWMVKGGKVVMIDNGATFASNEHYIAEGTGMRRQPRLRTLESSPVHSTGIQPMSSKFAEGVQNLLKNRDAISEQMAANGLKSKEIDSFWKRAEFLSKTRVFGFSQDTLMEFARLSEGIKNPWD